MKAIFRILTLVIFLAATSCMANGGQSTLFPKIGEVITETRMIELCQYFEMEKQLQRILANPGAFKDWTFDGCSMVPDDAVIKIIGVKDLKIICLRHDLRYAVGDPENDEERLEADYILGLDLLKGGASAKVSKTFFESVQLGGHEGLGFSFSWGFAWR